MRYEGEIFGTEPVLLDENEFVNCTFNETVLIYGGSPNVQFSGCAFNAVKWQFAGAAAYTLSFMSRIYNAGGGEIIESMFAGIRSGDIRPQKGQ